MVEKQSVLRETDDAARKLARTLLRSARHAALGVIEPDSNGFPFVSRTLVGIDIDGAPVILVSALSTHTQALLVDGRCSLLTGEPGKGDPLAYPRLTVQCEALRVDRQSDEQSRIRARFLRRHPKAELYVDFPDFMFFRLVPGKASLNGGFGRAYSLTGEDLLIASKAMEDLAAMEVDAIVHMNSDHSDPVDRYARAESELPADADADAKGWHVCGIDAAGLDLIKADRLRRVEFDVTLQSATELRPLLVKLYR